MLNRIQRWCGDRRTRRHVALDISGLLMNDFCKTIFLIFSIIIPDSHLKSGLQLQMRSIRPTMQRDVLPTERMN